MPKCYCGHCVGGVRAHCNRCVEDCLIDCYQLESEKVAGDATKEPMDAEAKKKIIFKTDEKKKQNKQICIFIADCCKMQIRTWLGARNGNGQHAHFRNKWWTWARD